jgi:regulator of protease activity HflC (stomatin/prohibitin superfamily)
MNELIGLLVKLFGALGPIVVILVILAIFILPQALRILREYERGVIFRLGKLVGAKGPGMIFLIPVVDKMVRMDLRVVTIDGGRGGLFPRRQSNGRRGEGGEFLESDFAYLADDVAQRAGAVAVGRLAFATRHH